MAGAYSIPPMLTLTAGDEALDRDCVPTGGPDVALGATFTRMGLSIDAFPMPLMDREAPTVAELQRRLALLVGAQPAPTVADLRCRFDLLVGDAAMDSDDDVEMNEDFVVLLPEAGECEYSFEDI